MRWPYWIALAFVILLYLARVPPGREPPGPSAEAATATSTAVTENEPPRQPVHLKVRTRLGSETMLTIDEDTEVLVVATWCSATRRLNSILKDPRSTPYVRGKRLVYLLPYDELDMRVARWVREGRVSQAEADAYLRDQPAGPRLVNPEFLSDAATRLVYYYDDEHPLRFDGYPSAFSGPPNEFLLNHGVWVSRRLGVPKELKDALFADHTVEGG